MIDYIWNFEWTGLMGILLYWVPSACCCVGYTARTANNYMQDKRQREEAGARYEPTDTIGALIGRAIVSALPVANLWAAAFDIAPKFLGGFFDWLDRVFNTPLVPDSDSYKSKRKQ